MYLPCRGNTQKCTEKNVIKNATYLNVSMTVLYVSTSYTQQLPPPTQKKKRFRYRLLYPKLFLNYIQRDKQLCSVQLLRSTHSRMMHLCCPDSQIWKSAQVHIPFKTFLSKQNLLSLNSESVQVKIASYVKLFFFLIKSHRIVAKN